MRLLPLCIVLLAAVPCEAMQVRLLSAVDGQKPTAGEKLVREGTRVMLYAVAAGAPATNDGTWHVQWFKIEPTNHYLSNTDPSFHWQEIDYANTPMPACEDKFTCPADMHTTALEDRGGLGTMTFRVTVSHAGETGSSPGSEQLYRGGLRADVARVTVRRDDTYLGYLTELFNTPYIWGSAGEPSTVHQSERRIGADCADFVTYGIRRLGFTQIPYTSTWSLPKYTHQLFTSKGPDANGVYLDAHDKPIPFGPGGVRPGDLLLFPGHVAAVERDAEPLGVLSSSDVMVHTSWHEPTEQSIGSSEYKDKPVKVVRWKVLEK